MDLKEVGCEDVPGSGLCLLAGLGSCTVEPFVLLPECLL